MKILLLGSSGQLGKSIILTKPKEIELFAFNKNELNILNKDKLKEKIKLIQPYWIINTAAYTNVDQAENETEYAFKVNRDGPRIISEIIKDLEINLLHISTDFVFDGMSNIPYKTHDKTNPISVYGNSKFLGEEEIKKILYFKKRFIILRTSWLMGPFSKNFAKTMMRLHQEKDFLNVVNDQIGCPTSSISLANICWNIIKKSKSERNYNFPEIMHWSDKGSTSWFEVAKEVGNIGLKLKKISKIAEVYPISSNDYKSLAERPSYSVLDTTETESILGINPLNWRKSLYKSFMKLEYF